MADKSPGLWRTTHLGTAAFALSRGLKLRPIERNGDEIRFVFEDPNGRGESLRYEYANSPERIHDESVRTLRDLMFGGRR